MADMYLLGHLSTDEAQAFEEHFLGCAKCASVLEESKRFILAMKYAATAEPLRAGEAEDEEEGTPRSLD